MATAGITYENYLKAAYSIKSDGKILAITDTSCYHLAEETAWLAANLPATAQKDGYLQALSGLGIDDPDKIFNKLLSIGALREKSSHNWKSLLKIVITPRVKLFSSNLQEKFFRPFVSSPGLAGKIVRILAPISATGLLWGAWVIVAGTSKSFPLLIGKPDGVIIITLVILGSLIHELGHSFTAMSSGIGLRPVGVSIYLIYPVFYTNVSGIEKVGLSKRALIDCGGFVFQGAFLFLLLLVCSFTGNPSIAEAARWIIVIIIFNLNPLFRTDGYWLYKDVYSEFKSDRWARALHYIYLAAFVIFSIWFLWRIGSRLGNVWRDLNLLFHSPGYFFSGGYRIILGAYFIFVGFAGGLRRFQEGHQEWKELRSIKS